MNNNKKEKIPSTVRNTVWNKYISENEKVGKCHCCKLETISSANFECGHIISEKNGGKPEVGNLRPICSQCNKSMGTSNMDDFIKKYNLHQVKVTKNTDEKNILNEIADDSDSEYDLPDLDSIDDEEEEEEENDTEINFQTSTYTVKSFYDTFLANDILNTCPEYQRNFCWSHSKQLLFIDSIMKNYITPMIIIYKIPTKKLDKNSKYKYECIDGQNRVITIKKFIESSKQIDGNYLFFKTDCRKRSIYNRDVANPEIKKYKQLEDLYKQKFNMYPLQIVMVQSVLTDQKKRDIFMRLQNGEKMTQMDKLKNMEHKIIEFITRSDFDFRNYVVKLKPIIQRIKTCYLWVFSRIILIFDGKDLDKINYLDSVIRKYLENNALSVNLSKKIDKEELDNFLTYIIKKNKKFGYSYLLYLVCYLYVNKPKKYVYTIFRHEKLFEKYNSPEPYKFEEGKMISGKKMVEIYNNLINEIEIYLNEDEVKNEKKLIFKPGKILTVKGKNISPNKESFKLI